MNVKIKACRKISAASTPSYYYYALNSRGDVIGLYNSSGALIVNYKYDAYGKLLGITNSSGSAITAKYSYGVLTPLRYRGYVYDTETGLYYLQSRYYDPTTCRFINADGLVSTGQGILGYNMFAYCNNNPINMTDLYGNWPLWAKIAVAAAVTVVTVIVVPTVVNHIINNSNKKKIDKELKDSYTKEEAKEEINNIVSKYSSECSVTFDKPCGNGYMVEISNSYHINSRYDRQKVSTIIEKTDVTDREYDNISSEWLLHNLATPVSPLYESAHSAGLDYTRDSRWYIVALTKTLEVLGWE